MTGTLPPPDEELATALDDLGRCAVRLRRLFPRLTPRQCAALAEASPWGEGTNGTLADVDTWAAVAAAGLRDGESKDGKGAMSA